MIYRCPFRMYGRRPRFSECLLSSFRILVIAFVKWRGIYNGSGRPALLWGRESERRCILHAIVLCFGKYLINSDCSRRHRNFDLWPFISLIILSYNQKQAILLEKQTMMRNKLLDPQCTIVIIYPEGLETLWIFIQIKGYPLEIKWFLCVLCQILFGISNRSSTIHGKLILNISPNSTQYCKFLL